MKAVLRRELLLAALDDWVPLGEIEGILVQDVGLSLPEVTDDLILEMVETLVQEDLVTVGDLASGQFAPWPGTGIDWHRELSARLANRGGKGLWDFEVWFSLTDVGRATAQTMG